MPQRSPKSRPLDNARQCIGSSQAPMRVVRSVRRDRRPRGPAGVLTRISPTRPSSTSSDFWRARSRGSTYRLAGPLPFMMRPDGR
jgi:hypothetical protein